MEPNAYKTNRCSNKKPFLGHLSHFQKHNSLLWTYNQNRKTNFISFPRMKLNIPSNLSLSWFLATTFIIIITYLGQCKADELQLLQQDCENTIECEKNHRLIIRALVSSKRICRKSNKTKYDCNEQRICKLGKKIRNCKVQYHCISSNFDISTRDGSCRESIDCGQHSIIIIHDVIGKDRCQKTDKAGNNCNSKQKCQLNETDTNCSVRYYCIKDNSARQDLAPTIFGRTNVTTEMNVKVEANGFSTMNSSVNNFKDQNNSSKNNKNPETLIQIIIIITVVAGILIVVAITISILWWCCRRCNKVTINQPVTDSSKNYSKESEVIKEEPECEIRYGFIPSKATRETFDSVGFWSDEEDYDPDNDPQSKMKPQIYATGNCIYRRQSSKSEIYMNTVIPPAPAPARLFEKEKDAYVNMNPKSNNKQHFNVFL